MKRTQTWRMRVKLQKQSDNPTDNQYLEHEQLSDVNIPSTSTSSFTSRFSRCRQVNKTKSTLPKTPSKRAKVVKKLIESPTTSKILCKEGVILTPELQIADDVITSLQENLADTKQSKIRKEKCL